MKRLMIDMIVAVAITLLYIALDRFMGYETNGLVYAVLATLIVWKAEKE